MRKNNVDNVEVRSIQFPEQSRGQKQVISPIFPLTAWDFNKQSIPKYIYQSQSLVYESEVIGYSIVFPCQTCFRPFYLPFGLQNIFNRHLNYSSYPSNVLS